MLMDVYKDAWLGEWRMRYLIGHGLMHDVGGTNSTTICGTKI